MRFSPALRAPALSLFSILSALSAFVSSAPAQLNPTQVRLGAGLDSLKDWSRSQMVTDLAKASRAFGPPADPWEPPVPTDADGWPTQDAGAMMLCCQPVSSGLAGVYQISFECAATPEVRPILNTGTVENVSRDPATGVVTAQLIMTDANTDLVLGFFGTNGGFRNLHVYAPGTQPGRQWTDRFKAHASRFKVLRFMDTTLTNNCPVSQWSQRSLPESPTWRTKTGIPYEVCIDLCNEVGADYWVNIPHRADDDFVRNLARLVRDRLDPQLNVYIENSNEVWNTLFLQGTENRNAAIAEVNAGGSDLNYDGSGSTGDWALRRFARRLIQISRIFAQEFGGPTLPNRVRPILAGQVVNDNGYFDMLRYVETIHGPPREFFHALGVAPYFWAPQLDSWAQSPTVADYLVALEASIDGWHNSKQWERLTAYSAWHRLAPMTAYEGGIDTRGAAWRSVKRALHSDPAIEGLCIDYLDNWHKDGGGAFCWFIAGAGDWSDDWGGYHLTENMLQQDMPKILALDQVVAAQRPALTAGTQLPAIIDPRRHVQRAANWMDQPVAPELGTGFFYDYMIRSQAPRAYSVSFDASSWQENTSVDLLINGAFAGAIAFDQTGTPENLNFRRSLTTPVVVGEGVSVLRVRSQSSGGFYLQNIVFQACDSIDFNHDGVAPDTTDLTDFLAVFAGESCPSPQGCNSIDFNLDGVYPDTADLFAFLHVFSGGDCE